MGEWSMTTGSFTSGNSYLLAAPGPTLCLIHCYYCFKRYQSLSKDDLDCTNSEGLEIRMAILGLTKIATDFAWTKFPMRAEIMMLYHVGNV